MRRCQSCGAWVEILYRIVMEIRWGDQVAGITFWICRGCCFSEDRIKELEARALQMQAVADGTVADAHAMSPLDVTQTAGGQ